MSLGIAAFRGLTVAGPRDGAGIWSRLDEGMTGFLDNRSFPGRFEGLDESKFYHWEETWAFQAGSYSGYNRWREWLAGLMDTTPKRVWAGEAPRAFRELIDFADNEGTIGPVCAARLAADFQQWDLKAKAGSYGPDGDYAYELYTKFRRAFEMAANGGAVEFN